MSRRVLLIAILMTFAGCQRAARFPAPAGKATAERKAEVRAIWGWANNDHPPRDLPIRFVASDRPEWKSLPGFWNLIPHPAAGIRTIHIAQSPLGIAATFALLEPVESITIKVPRGLPDPTPLIPAANPPTFGKWRLGKKIFFDNVLLAGTSKFSCASCHDPAHGFTETSRVSLDGKRNTLSLINVAFNRDQFWDGRVRSLEEVVVGSLEDELAGNASRKAALVHHRWGGMAQRMDKSEEYRYQFRVVFGVDRVTQDDIAKALATYMRTILSGDSLFDRANELAAADNAPSLTAAHATKAFDEPSDKSLAAVAAEFGGKERLFRLIEQGQRAFYSAGCVVCHPSPLFTNHGFANILVDDSGKSQAVAGDETGRFAVLPIGLKDPALRGAYRVPTLRNLSATAPYFHTGTRATLREVVDYFRVHLDARDPLLAAPLRSALESRAHGGLNPSLFGEDDRTALLAFLLSLDGRPVDPIVSSRP
jgi:cytochrome c peroxidase